MRLARRLPGRDRDHYVLSEIIQIAAEMGIDENPVARAAEVVGSGREWDAT